MTGLQMLLFNNLNFLVLLPLCHPLTQSSGMFHFIYSFPPSHLFISFSTKEKFMEKNQTHGDFVEHLGAPSTPWGLAVPVKRILGLGDCSCSSPVSMLAAYASWGLDGNEGPESGAQNSALPCLCNGHGVDPLLPLVEEAVTLSSADRASPIEPAGPPRKKT